MWIKKYVLSRLHPNPSVRERATASFLPLNTPMQRKTSKAIFCLVFQWVFFFFLMCWGFLAANPKNMWLETRLYRIFWLPLS